MANISEYRKENKIGDVLKILMDQNQVSVSDLANELELSDSSIYYYLQNKKTPSSKVLKKIEQFFDLPEGDLNPYICYADENVFIRFVNSFRKYISYSADSDWKYLDSEFLELKNKYKILIEKSSCAFSYDIVDALHVLLEGTYKFVNDNYEEGLEIEEFPSNRSYVIERLRVAFESLNLDLKDVSEKTGVNSHLIQDYLKYRKNPSNKTLEKIRIGLDLPEDFFTSEKMYKIGDSIYYSRIISPQGENVAPTEPCFFKKEKTNQDIQLFNKSLNSVWNCLKKIRTQCNSEQKEKINQSLKRLYEQLIEKGNKYNQIKKDDTESN